jgi:hypothetical protein
MVELRLAVPNRTCTAPPKLQWRNRLVDPWGNYTMWSEWQDVPIVVLKPEPEPVEECPHESWSNESAELGWRSRCLQCGTLSAGSGQ